MVSTQFCSTLFIANAFAMEGRATGAAFNRNATMTVASDPAVIMYFSCVEYKIIPHSIFVNFCIELSINFDNNCYDDL